MTDYPNSIYAPRTKANRSGVVYDSTKQTVIFKEDIAKLDDEVVAIETDLEVFFDLIHWNSIDGFTQVKDGAGVITVLDAEVQLDSGIVTNNDTDLMSTGFYRGLVVAGKVLTIEFIVNYLSAITANKVWLYFCYPTGNPPYDEDDSVGFKIVNGEVFANNGDNIDKTQTTTGITLSAGNQNTRLKFVFTPGTNCKFYVNDVLKVTHTTRLTTKDQMRIYLGIQTTAEAAKTASFGRILIKKAY